MQNMMHTHDNEGNGIGAESQHLFLLGFLHAYVFTKPSIERKLGFCFLFSILVPKKQLQWKNNL